MFFITTFDDGKSSVSSKEMTEAFEYSSAAVSPIIAESNFLQDLFAAMRGSEIAKILAAGIEDATNAIDAENEL